MATYVFLRPDIMGVDFLSDVIWHAAVSEHRYEKLTGQTEENRNRILREIGYISLKCEAVTQHFSIGPTLHLMRTNLGSANVTIESRYVLFIANFEKSGEIDTEEVARRFGFSLD